MNIYLKSILCLLVILLVGCSAGSKSQMTTQEEKVDTIIVSEDSIEEVDSSSVCNPEFLFDSKLAMSNPSLATLIDSLYTHVRGEGFPAKLNKEEKWMKNYRRMLCEYYDARNTGVGIASEYVKTDSVLNEGERMIEKDEDGGTVGMMVHNAALYSITVCREYCLLAQMKELCDDEAVRVLLDKEWDAYKKMYEKALDVACGITVMNYWGGSIIGPLCSYNRNEMAKARVETYRNVLSVVKREKSANADVDLNGARDNLISFYSDTFDKTYANVKEWVDEESTEESRERFYETEKQTRQEIKDLPVKINEWIAVLEKLDKELSTKGYSRCDVKKVFSTMFIRWKDVLNEDV